MTQEIRHTQRSGSSNTVLLPGEIAYSTSNTIKIGDGERTFSNLPEFSSNATAGDNKTIQTNSSQKIEAHGTINQNPDAVYVPGETDHKHIFDWIGTLDEYTNQNIENDHPDWLCFIIDDFSGTLSSSVYTKSEIDAFLSDKADGRGGAVMLSGNQNIEGIKTFLNNGIKVKSGQIDYTDTPSTDKTLPIVMVEDKNGQRVGNIELCQDTNGAFSLGINSAVKVGVNTVYSPTIRTCISQDGQTTWTDAGQNPTSTTANDTQIATTAHVMNVLQAIYPVGSLYIGTQNTCPMASFFGTWSLVSSGRALWTGDGTVGDGSSVTNASTGATNTISAGLPNITGTFRGRNNYNDAVLEATGVFGTESRSSATGASGAGENAYAVTFDASHSNTIYGQSTTVQPPAYVVNVWRRTA